MLNKSLVHSIFYALFFGVILSQSTYAQDTNEVSDSVVLEVDKTAQIEVSDTLDLITEKLFEPNPTKAGLYSAILPGLGQVYNKKYWKVPLVWGLIGTGIGFAAFFNSEHNLAREAYLNALNGQPVADRFANANIQTLADFQDDQRRFRDYAIALTALAYLLNVMDAAVDAHLYSIKKDPDLSFEPVIIPEPMNQYDVKPGIAFRFRF